MPSANAGIAYIDAGLELSTATAFAMTTDHASIGISLEQLNNADVMHVSVVDHAGSAHVHYRYRDSGSVAAVGLGHVLGSLDSAIIRGNENIRNFSIIEQSGTVAVWITLLTYGIPPTA